MNKNIIAQSGWQSPSNIAIVKYWGKYGQQLPMNPSVSFTLSNSQSKTKIFLSEKETDALIEVDFYFEGKQNEAFKSKIEKFFTQVYHELSYLTQYKITIESSNTFPHSAGIASSASSMSALALCLIDLEQQINSKTYNKQEFTQRASYFSRLASGSASRSVFPYASVWGEMKEIAESSQEYAIAFPGKLHPVFESYMDAILIIDAGEKSVSSRAGHALMNGHAYSAARKEQAFAHMRETLEVLKKGDVAHFVEIAENEALSLHAMMLSSKPWYSLIKQGTLLAIEKIKQFRESAKIPVGFTLDAGPNVHILYPESFFNEVNDFIKNELIDLSATKQVIEDKVGMGPSKL